MNSNIRINCDILIATILVAVVIVCIILIYNQLKEQEKNLKNLKNNVIGSPSLEAFENNNSSNNEIESVVNNNSSSNDLDTLKKENQELKSYMKVHGLYPHGKKLDLSQYVLKTNVQPEKICPDMSKYVLKTSIPPPIKCPEINRDDWIRKSELPPNWNKECPAHPDLTDYVLKSTIPPTQKCPPCICPKIKVNAGLCREPNKDDCIKTGILDEACPKPKPCPKPPAPTPCPRPPPPPKCPELKCPECPVQGKCPEPERCPPTQDCPKCYDVKYLKVPVVKSEGVPKPEKETIFPTNLIETKLIKQQTQQQPRMPRILSIQQSRNNNDLNNNDEELEPELLKEVDDIIEPPASSKLLSYSKDLSNKKNNNKNNNKNKNKQNNKQNRKPVIQFNNKCNKVNLDKVYEKYGVNGFNNVL